MDKLNTPTALADIAATITGAPAFAFTRLEHCVSCDKPTPENRCGLQPEGCFLSAMVQLDWKECPEGKWGIDGHAKAVS